MKISIEEFDKDLTMKKKMKKNDDDNTCINNNSSPDKPKISRSISDINIKRFGEPLKTIGKGSYGEVTLHIDSETGKQVVIKSAFGNEYEEHDDDCDGECDNYECNNFELTGDVIREISALTTLNPHPNIVPLIGSNIMDSPMKLVLEKADNSLWDAIKQDMVGGDNIRTQEILYHIVRGMAWMNSKGIWHRDLKPQNILLMPEGNAVIADFGLSRGRPFKWEGLTDNVYTLWWRAPEILVKQFVGVRMINDENDENNENDENDENEPEKNVEEVEVEEEVEEVEEAEEVEVEEVEEAEKLKEGNNTNKENDCYHHYDKKAEVWSVGMCMWDLLSAGNKYATSYIRAGDNSLEMQLWKILRSFDACETEMKWKNGRKRAYDLLKKTSTISSYKQAWENISVKNGFGTRQNAEKRLGYALEDKTWDLLTKMLHLMPNHRIEMEDILKHAYFDNVREDIECRFPVINIQCSIPIKNDNNNNGNNSTSNGNECSLNEINNCINLIPNECVGIKPKNWQIIGSWMWNIVKEYEIAYSVYFLALHVLRSYLWSRKTKEDKFQLAGIACLGLSALYLGNDMTLENFKYYVITKKKIVTKKSLSKMQKKILSQVGNILHFPTSWTKLCELIENNHVYSYIKMIKNRLKKSLSLSGSYSLSDLYVDNGSYKKSDFNTNTHHKLAGLLACVELSPANRIQSADSQAIVALYLYTHLSTKKNIQTQMKKIEAEAQAEAEKSIDIKKVTENNNHNQSTPPTPPTPLLPGYKNAVTPVLVDLVSNLLSTNTNINTNIQFNLRNIDKERVNKIIGFCKHYEQDVDADPMYTINSQYCLN